MGNKNQQTINTIDDLRISSARESEFDGPFVVRIESDTLAEPVDFGIAGAQAVALRLCVAAECAMKGIEANPRVYSTSEHDLQALVSIESFHCGAGPCVQLDICNFRLRTTAAGAVRIACRFLYCSELARMKLGHTLVDGDLSDEHVEAAYLQCISRATQCLVRGQMFEQESKQS